MTEPVDKPEGEGEHKPSVVADEANASTRKPAEDTPPNEGESTDGDKGGEGEGEGEGTGEQDDKKSDELDTETWGTTGDETGDSVLLVLQNSGVEPEVAKALLYDAVKAGDPTKIDRDALVEKFGKANANLIMAGVENFVGRQAAKIEAITKEVHSTAGGKENWNKVAAWAAKHVSAEDRTEYAAMIDAGGAKARFAASEMLTRYNADEKNTTINSTARVEGDGKAPDTGRAIGRRAYAEELQRAHRNNASKAVIAEIQAARERGRKRGL